MKPANPLLLLTLAALAAALTAACQPAPAAEATGAHDPPDHAAGETVLALPSLPPPDLGGAPLRVVATTSIIGDVVGRVGGEAIALTVLLDPGVDAHSYQPGPQDLAAVEDAHVIFVNGWGLEGALVEVLETIGSGVIVVPISAGIVPLTAGEHGHAGEAEGASAEAADNHGHGGADPHVWFDLRNVEHWVENAEHVLAALDPAHAAAYAANAAAYLAELAELEAYVETRLAELPPENRTLVTNHDSFAYFAHAYGFDVIATVIPAASTLAEPSAGDLADLVRVMEAHGACTIFTETSVSDALAQTVAAELDGCGEVRVIPLYTESLGPPGSGAETFLGMFKANLDAILAGLAP